MSEKLKPCPFCGNRPSASNELSREILVSCSNPLCPASWYGMPVDVWNNRYVEDKLEEQMNRLVANGIRSWNFVLKVAHDHDFTASYAIKNDWHGLFNYLQDWAKEISNDDEE